MTGIAVVSPRQAGLENLCGRFNRALGVGAAGFSEGATCASAATVEVDQ